MFPAIMPWPMTKDANKNRSKKGDDDDDNRGGAKFNFEGYYNKNGYCDNNDGTEMVYNSVFKEIYDPNYYEGLGVEEEARIARMNHKKRRAAKMRRKKRKLPFRGF
jgi:hypothetical protein